MRPGVVAALASLVLAWAGPALAANTASFSNTLVDAVVAADNAKQPPPRIADPAWAGRFAEAYDMAIIGQLDRGDLNSVLQTCAGANLAAQAYMEYGVGRLPAAADPKLTAAARANAQMANVTRYQDEVTPALRFMVPCLAVALRGAEDLARTLPADYWTDTRKSGINQMREGTVMVYVGVVQMAMGANELRPANRDAILDVAVKDADVFASAIHASDRLKVRTTVDAALHATVPPDVRAKLTRIREAMSRTDCVGLCAL
jgi:hypothetical protein